MATAEIWIRLLIEYDDEDKDESDICEVIDDCLDDGGIQDVIADTAEVKDLELEFIDSRCDLSPEAMRGTKGAA